MGLSYAEPLVDFTFGNGIRIFYNNVDSNSAEIIYNSHIIENKIYYDLVFGQIVPE